jgi:hypothetical protein
MSIRTVFVITAECARGEARGWHDLVQSYGAIGQFLLEHYFPALQPEIDSHLGGVFLRARAQENAWFRSSAFANEREFAMSFRELVFAYGREEARIPMPQLTLEQVRQLMTDLSILEREMLWLFIKGYDVARISVMLMNAEATAAAVKKLADDRLAQILPGTAPDAFNISARVLIEAAEKSRTQECLPLKTFNNMVNGQISWRERELAEEHIKNCFYCLDRFTSFVEMIRTLNECAPLPEQRVQAILSALNLPAPAAKGLLGRLFSRA